MNFEKRLPSFPTLPIVHFLQVVLKKKLKLTIINNKKYRDAF